MTKAKRAGHPWTAEEDDMLRKAAALRYYPADIAEYVHRSHMSILMRMVRLKLIVRADDGFHRTNPDVYCPLEQEAK